jgi:hypothetical protein
LHNSCRFSRPTAFSLVVLRRPCRRGFGRLRCRRL